MVSLKRSPTNSSSPSPMTDGIANGLAVLAAAGALDSAKSTPRQTSRAQSRVSNGVSNDASEDCPQSSNAAGSSSVSSAAAILTTQPPRQSQPQTLHRVQQQQQQRQVNTQPVVPTNTTTTTESTATDAATATATVTTTAGAAEAAAVAAAAAAPILPSTFLKPTRASTSHAQTQHTTTRPKRTTEIGEKGCNCKNSKCLKLYCECFARAQTCGSHCNCRNCRNDGQHETLRHQAVQAILERNPNAFQPKVKRKQLADDAGGTTSNPGLVGSAAVSTGDGGRIVQREKHNKGCNCRKSGCLKRYCECFQASVLCSELCKCVNCRNFEGSGDIIAVRNGGRKPTAQSCGERVTTTSPKSRKAPLLAPAPTRRGQSSSSVVLTKRPANAVKMPKEPPAKRVLFSKEPVFKSTVEEAGTPGSLHFEPARLMEDNSEQVVAAANKALGTKIVTEAQKDTAMLLQLFAEGAAEALANDSPRRRLDHPRTDGSGLGRNLAPGAPVKAEDQETTAEVKSDVLKLLCREDGVGDAMNGHDGIAVEDRPKWLGDSEKKVLEQCARTLYVISSGGGNGGADGGAGAGGGFRGLGAGAGVDAGTGAGADTGTSTGASTGTGTGTGVGNHNTSLKKQKADGQKATT